MCWRPTLMRINGFRLSGCVIVGGSAQLVGVAAIGLVTLNLRAFQFRLANKIFDARTGAGNQMTMPQLKQTICYDTEQPVAESLK